MWILPHALGFSVFHYVIRVRQAPYSPNFELEHIVPDSKDIMLIASLLTLINAALISMLWSYGADRGETRRSVAAVAFSFRIHDGSLGHRLSCLETHQEV